MAAVAEDISGRLAHHYAPTVKVKLSLMKQLSIELKKRYGTQQVAADAMEMTQPEISALYGDRFDRFSIQFLIHLAAKLDKQVSITVS